VGDLRTPLPVNVASADAGAAPLTIRGVPVERRGSLAGVIEQSFRGIYRWHASRTLQSVTHVRAASEGDDAIGLTMFTMLGPDTGYLYYVAVVPSRRQSGVGGALLDDALEALRAQGALEVLACIRAENLPSIRLFASRGFRRTSFRERARERGVAGAAKLWRRMVVAPGERVFRKVM